MKLLYSVRMSAAIFIIVIMTNGLRMNLLKSKVMIMIRQKSINSVLRMRRLICINRFLAAG